MTKDQKIQILKLRATGYGYKRIAQKLGISPNTVKSFCRRHKTGDDSETELSPALSGETTFCANCGKEIKQRAKVKPRRFCDDQATVLEYTFGGSTQEGVLYFPVQALWQGVSCLRG